jgi:hypothetical protein
MLDTYAETQEYLVDFSLTIYVTDDSLVIPLPAPISSVIPDFVDPGIIIETDLGQVTIRGKYRSIIPTTWHWLDNTRSQQSGTEVPAVGTYEKITQVDSPPTLTKNCTYTIVSSTGAEQFVHTVTIVSYSRIADKLTILLDASPGP